MTQDILDYFANTILFLSIIEMRKKSGYSGFVVLLIDGCSTHTQLNSAPMKSHQNIEKTSFSTPSLTPTKF